MSGKYGTKWTREETILACDLYCRVPFKKISKTNPEIIELARLIGRTPSSVGLKMANLAHFDKELRARNRLGMSNASKLDEAIYREFENNWSELAFEAQRIKAKFLNTTVEYVVEDSIKLEMGVSDLPSGTYKEHMIKTRVGQYFFRTAVLSAYENRCCITGINLPELLIASHIKPWKDADEKTERTNPSNGLSLNALHDKAFDRGLITIDENYRIVNSRRIEEVDMDIDTKEWFKSFEGRQIVLPDRFYPDRKFIEYHNDVIFLGA